MQHVEKLTRATIHNILEGKKCAEMVFLKERKPPMECLHESDEVFFQSKDGFAIAKASVTKVEEFDDLTPEKAQGLLEEHKTEILPTLLNLERDIYFQYATLFWFDHVTEIRPFFISDNINGWLQTADIEMMMKNGR